MKYIFKRKNELKISKWSGGSTTELFIFPQGSSYIKRDFEVRISSASVEDSPSAFTELKGYHRVLMPISDCLRLVFKNQDKVELSPFEAVEFDGGWDTVSYGVCTDIGIMLSAKWKGNLFAAENRVYKCEHGFAFVYAVCDGIKVVADKSEYFLLKGDFLIFETTDGDKISLILPDKNTAIMAMVYPAKNS